MANRTTRRSTAKSLPSDVLLKAIINKVTEEAKHKAASTSINTILSITLFLLLTTFEFTKKDANKFMTEFMKGVDHINAGYLTPQQLAEDVYKLSKIKVSDYE